MSVAQKIVGIGVGGTVPVTGTVTATLFNPATFNIFAAGVRNATITSATITNPGYTGLILKLGVTAVPGVDTIRLDIRVAGNAIFYHGLFGTVVANGTYVYVFGPGVLPADYSASVTGSKVLRIPSEYVVRLTHSGAGNFTYSLDAYPIP